MAEIKDFEIEDGKLIRYHGSEEEVMIPEIVVEIGASAFKGCVSIKKIVIPSNTEIIRDKAFSGCSSLTEIILPKSLKTIGWFVFEDCTSLTKVKIQEGMNYLGGWIRQFENMEYLSIPSSLTEMGSFWWWNFPNLKTIEVAEGNPVYRVSNNCLIQTTKKRLVAGTAEGQIPADGSIAIIGEGAFSRREIESMVIPEGVEEIENGAFAECSRLKTMILPEGLKKIGDSAFSGCSSLTEIILPKSLKTIGWYIFEDCTSLTKVKIQEGMNYLGSWICQFENMEYLSIPASLTGMDSFWWDFPNLKTIEVAEGNPVFKILNNCLIQTTEKRLVVGTAEGQIPADGSISIIGKGAFSRREIESMVIPEGVEEIENGAFEGCSRLKTMILPEGLKEIGDSAFSRCSSLTEITFPNSLKRIRTNAFHGVGRFIKVHIPELKRWLSIDFEKMYGHYQLPTDMSYSNPLNHSGLLYVGEDLVEDLVIPMGFSELSRVLFAGCSSIRSVTIPDTLKRIDEGCFWKCRKLKAVYVSSMETWLGIEYTYGANPLRNGAKLYIDGEALIGDWTVPESIEKIPDYCFENYKHFKNVYLHSDVTNIGEWSFSTATILHIEVFPETAEKVLENISKWVTASPVVITRTDEKMQAEEKVVVRTSWIDSIFMEDGTIDHEQYDLYLHGSARKKLNDAGKIRASLYRLRYPYELDEMVKQEYISVCKKNVKKLLDFVIPEEDPSLVVLLFRIGAVDETNREDVLKRLSKSNSEEMKKLSERIDEAVAEDEKKDTEDKAAVHSELYHSLTEEYSARLVGAGGFKMMGAMQLTVLGLPDVLLKENGENAPKEILAYVLASYGSQFKKFTDYENFTINKNADKAASLFDAESFQDALVTVVNNVDWGKYPHVMIPYCRYADHKKISALLRVMNQFQSHLKRVLERAMMLSETRDAIMYFDKIGELRAYAKMRKTDEETMRESILFEFGLDKEGKKEYDLGVKKIEISLMKDLSLVIFDRENHKIIKSIPKKNVDPEVYAKISSEFAEMKKNIKKVVKMRNDELFEDFLSGSTVTAKRWIESYTKNPVLRQVASLIVWRQGQSAFILKDGGAVDCNGRDYKIGKDPIAVAHPMEMTKEEVEKWRKYFTSHGLKQPFVQVWEPVADGNSVKSDRYAGAMIPFFIFRGREKHGISVEYSANGRDVEINFAYCNAEIERIDWDRYEVRNEDRFEITSFEFRNYTRGVNHIVAYLDQATLHGRILNDDVTIANDLHDFTLAQITGFIDIAVKNNCNHALAVLLEYKNKMFTEYDPMDGFTLE